MIDAARKRTEKILAANRNDEDEEDDEEIEESSRRLLLGGGRVAPKDVNVANGYSATENLHRLTDHVRRNLKCPSSSVVFTYPAVLCAVILIKYLVAGSRPLMANIFSLGETLLATSRYSDPDSRRYSNTKYRIEQPPSEKALSRTVTMVRFTRRRSCGCGTSGTNDRINNKALAFKCDCFLFFFWKESFLTPAPGRRHNDRGGQALAHVVVGGHIDGVVVSTEERVEPERVCQRIAVRLAPLAVISAPIVHIVA